MALQYGTWGNAELGMPQYTGYFDPELGAVYSTPHASGDNILGWFGGFDRQFMEPGFDFKTWFEQNYARPYAGEDPKAIYSGLKTQVAQDAASSDKFTDLIEGGLMAGATAGIGALSGGFGLSSLMDSVGGGSTAAGGGDWASMGGGVDPGTSIVGQPNVWQGVADMGPLAGPMQTPGSEMDFAGDWASQGGGVDPGTTMFPGSESSVGSPYADWASQGGGVDPSSTALGGAIPSGSGGGFFDKLGNWVTSPSGLSTLGTLVGSGINYLGATNAAKAQEKAASDQQGLLKYMYDQNRADLAPWREAGVGALGNLTNLTTPGKQFDMAMLDPGYAFRQAEGEKGINRAAAARGLWDSGRTYKALDRFNQDYATGEFGNVWNRNAGLAGIGQTAVGQGVNAGQNYGQNAGESMLQGANARASGYVGGANAISGGLASLINQYSQQAMLDKILGR